MENAYYLKRSYSFSETWKNVSIPMGVLFGVLIVIFWLVSLQTVFQREPRRVYLNGRNHSYCCYTSTHPRKHHPILSNNLSTQLTWSIPERLSSSPSALTLPIPTDKHISFELEINYLKYRWNFLQPSFPVSTAPCCLAATENSSLQHFPRSPTRRCDKVTEAQLYMQHPPTVDERS